MVVVVVVVVEANKRHSPNILPKNSDGTKKVNKDPHPHLSSVNSGDIRLPTLQIHTNSMSPVSSLCLRHIPATIQP